VLRSSYTGTFRQIRCRRDQKTDIAIRYTPSLAVGVLGVVLFAIGLAAHLFLLLRHRTWYFSTVVVGTAMEIVGYAFRILSSQQNPYSVPWFVVQVRFHFRWITMEERTLIETVLLHRRRTGLLLRGYLLSRLRHDQHLRKRIRAHATEACPLGLHRLRRRSDTHSSRGSCFGRNCLL
jgi:hypothetical protein